MPTLMGYDSDHPLCEGEVGREGVAVDTLADVEHLFDGIDLEQHLGVDDDQPDGVDPARDVRRAWRSSADCDLDRLSGTIQADILKEYMAQKEWIFPIAPSVRIVRDCITWCARNMQRYNPINISGYHISEAGSSPLHEAAFTMCQPRHLRRRRARRPACTSTSSRRALRSTSSPRRTSSRRSPSSAAVRRVYAKIMRERFGARNPESMRLRFHCQTAAASLTRPQPQINIVRTALQALAAVLGGAQSLHTNGMDEAFAIPTEEAMKIALRTQQIIAEESGVASVVDPLGGSYFVESLTTRVRARHLRDAGRGRAPRRHDQADRGGMVPASRLRTLPTTRPYARQSGAKPVIGVNRFHRRGGGARSSRPTLYDPGRPRSARSGTPARSRRACRMPPGTPRS